MTSILMILLYAIKIFYYIVIAHVVMSWLITFNVLNLHQPLVYQIWSGLNRLLEPIYGRIRNFLPNMGGLDLAPLVVFFGLYALQTIIINNLYSF
ncbi:YggT family protein [Monaibacterium marinum]|uniref:YggT family protein n=1 Tax=Pontivivens marinum TaxID=1690039 RepID=A0A2C9CQC3_9RHOB|nr:YggT family protein [Monaibacterium marinum]SOH93407.1 YggT family protein [Monaibacterium marinum]